MDSNARPFPKNNMKKKDTQICKYEQSIRYDYNKLVKKRVRREFVFHGLAAAWRKTDETDGVLRR